MIKMIQLYMSTIKYLKLSQIIYQILRRLQKKKINIYNGKKINFRPDSFHIKTLDCNESYYKKFRPEDILQNKLIFLNEEFIWVKGTWNNFCASHLWNFNLQYFEYGISLASAYKSSGYLPYKEKFFELLIDWIENVHSGDGWHPYTISLRIPNWLIAFDILEESIPQIVVDNIYTQYKWLQRNQEKQLLGNHYFENLKTLVICSKCFGEEERFNKYINKFFKEIDRQILEDGVHFELSLMYHRIILEDVIRIAHYLKQSEYNYTEKLFHVIKKMATAMHSLEKGMGKIPHFNDASEGIAKNSKLLEQFLCNEWNIIPEEITAFEKSGYYKLYTDNIAIIFDSGDLGPKYMCGHSHCDALSFELSINDNPVLVNSGTFNYQSPLRGFFRSTEAHNTALINQTQQSQLWGEHRAGKRITQIESSHTANSVQGSYVTYKGYYHKRDITILNNLEINLRDTIKGPLNSWVSIYFHAAPGLHWCDFDRNACVLALSSGKYKIFFILPDTTDYIIHKKGDICHYSSEFGEISNIEVLEIKFQLDRCENVTKEILMKLNYEEK